MPGPAKYYFCRGGGSKFVTLLILYSFSSGVRASVWKIDYFEAISFMGGYSKSYKAVSTSRQIGTVISKIHRQDAIAKTHLQGRKFKSRKACSAFNIKCGNLNVVCKVRDWRKKSNVVHVF